MTITRRVSKRYRKLRKAPALRRVEGRIARPPRFVIVGTGRSGSKYAAEALRFHGVRCGHESVFTHAGSWARLGADGDSSWSAIVYMAEFDGLVLHQVREPLSTVSSLAAMSMWSEGNPHREFISRAGIRVTGEPLLDAMHFYVDWNERCERYADYRYRIEDFDEELPKILDLISHAGEGSDTLDTPVSQRTNHRSDYKSPTDPGELPPSPERDRLIAMAERYGYL